MIARALFRFHPAHLHASNHQPSKSFISPTYVRSARNSFVSPTYAKSGGYTPLKMSARRHFLSHLSHLPLAAVSAEERFQSLAHTSEGVRYIGALPPVTDHESPNHQSLRLPRTNSASPRINYNQQLIRYSQPR
jgi:hypothetical protein